MVVMEVGEEKREGDSGRKNLLTLMDWFEVDEDMGESESESEVLVSSNNETMSIGPVSPSHHWTINKVVWSRWSCITSY